MKKLIIISDLIMGGLGIQTADAQFGIHINLHLGNRPVYAPVVEPVAIEEQPVYNNDYYYLPDVEAYYSVGERCYYYQDGDRWVSAAFLPGRYHDFDWRYAKHYEIHADRPYMHNDVYRGRFGGYMNRDDYYARAYPNRDRNNNNVYLEHDQFNSRGWNDQNRGRFDRHDDRNQNAYSQLQNYNRGGYSQPNQGGYNPSTQGGYNNQNPGRNQGGYNGSTQGSNTGYSQPAQGQGQPQGSRSTGQSQSQGNGNIQPTNRNGGQTTGSYNSNDHYVANKMGVVQDRSDFARPVRN